MSGLLVFTLLPACPFSNTGETHLFYFHKVFDECVIVNALIENLYGSKNEISANWRKRRAIRSVYLVS
jgi:hypothetical protein